MDDATNHERSRIRIKDLRLRTYIGFNDDEQQKRQDVVVNVTIDYDALAAARADDVDRALDYKGITKRIIAHVEGNRFLLLEKLVSDILDIAMGPAIVARAEVEVDKPHALRFSDSVSLSMAARRGTPGIRT